MTAHYPPHRTYKAQPGDTILVHARRVVWD